MVLSFATATAAVIASAPGGRCGVAGEAAQAVAKRRTGTTTIITTTTPSGVWSVVFA